MGITIAEIEQKEFLFKGAGYDPYDVDSYLDQICDEMIAMQDRIESLEADLEKAKAEATAAGEAVMPIPQEVVKEGEREPVQKTSETLESILLSAQRISDEAVENAKKRAAEIIDGAEKQASEVLGNVQEEKSLLEKEITSLKDAAGNYKKRFLTLLNEHMNLLEEGGDVFSAEEESDD